MRRRYPSTTQGFVEPSAHHPGATQCFVKQIAPHGCRNHELSSRSLRGIMVPNQVAKTKYRVVTSSKPDNTPQN